MSVNTISLKYILLLFSFSCTLLSCIKNIDTDTTSNTYSIFVVTKDTNEYLIQTNMLEEGTLDPKKDGVLLNSKEMDRELIIKDGFYYYINKKTGTFFKSILTNNKLLKRIDSVSIQDFYEHNYCWVTDDTLLLLGSDREDSLVKYAKIAVTNLKIRQGTIDIKKPYGYDFISIGFSNLKHTKLFMGYTFHVQSSDKFITSDTAYTSVLDYKTMNVQHTSTDTRSTFPGNYNLIEPASFVDEKGDFYFLTCPGVAMGNNIEKPTALFRIKNNDAIPDSSYFFNISASPISNHAYSIYYLGNNKAIIRSERKDLYKNWNEHWKVPHYEFYLLNIENQSAEKLKLPMDKGTRRQCVIVENDIAYISINSDTEGNYIWIYNITDGSLKKGLYLSDDTNFILRIDKMK